MEGYNHQASHDLRSGIQGNLEYGCQKMFTEAEMGISKPKYQFWGYNEDKDWFQPPLNYLCFLSNWKTYVPLAAHDHLLVLTLTLSKAREWNNEVLLGYRGLSSSFHLWFYCRMFTKFSITTYGLVVVCVLCGQKVDKQLDLNGS